MELNNGTSRTNTRTNKRQRRYRTPISCEPCRRSKLRCDREFPCAACKRRKCTAACTYTNHDDAAANYSGSSVSRTYDTEIGNGHHPDDDGQHSMRTRVDNVLQRPVEQNVADIQGQIWPSRGVEAGLCFPFVNLGPSMTSSDIISALPPTESCEYLITQYFSYVSPFFHILHGPTFQSQFLEFSNSRNNFDCGDLSWLALLFLVCSVAVNTIQDDDAVLANLSRPDTPVQDSGTISYNYRVMAMVCMCKDNFLVRHRLSTLEAILLLTWTIAHNEGAERSWAILGIALHIGIALQCHVPSPSTDLDYIQIERRRRCWAGLQMLHTYQAMLYRDIDMSHLLNTHATMPRDVNDGDILPDRVLPPSSTTPTQMSDMKFKISLFQLSARICTHLSSDAAELDEAQINSLDAAIAGEQKLWDATFLLDGAPSLLDTSSHARWCVLQLYAHQLYLGLHRPFSRSASGHRRSASKMKCVTSSATLLDIHRQLLENPRMRHYRWFARGGVTGSCAIHGAITLASCLLERSTEAEDLSTYRPMFDDAVARFDMLQDRNPIYAKANPVLKHLQTLLSPDQSSHSIPPGQEFGQELDNWLGIEQWLNPESINWDFWSDVLDTNLS